MVKVVAELEMVGVVNRPKFFKNDTVEPIRQGYRVVQVFVHGMLLSACDKAKRRCRLYFLLPSVVSPNTKPIQQGSLHHTVQASTCLLV